MIKYVNADIFDAKLGIITHQTNCMGKMGRGIAYEVKKRYPYVYNEYVNLCNQKPPQMLLGHCQLIKVDNKKYICNLFGQMYYGYNQNYTDYSAVDKAFHNLSLKAMELKLPVCIPYKMGCGYAGGDWNKYISIIKKYFDNRNDISIYIVKKED